VHRNARMGLPHLVARLGEARLTPTRRRRCAGHDWPPATLAAV